MPLLAGGADTGASDDFGWNSLHFAVSMGDRRVAMAILAAGDNPDTRTANGLTALHVVADPAMVEALVAAGAG